MRLRPHRTARACTATRRSAAHRRAPLPACLAIAGAAACTFPGTPQKLELPAYFASAPDVAPVRRVMVLPFETAPGVHADTGPVRDAFLGELAKLQRFEIVPLPDDAGDDAALYRGLRRGVLSTEALVALGERYRLDGVLLGTLTGYRPYKPPHLGLRVQLVSLHSAAAVWAAEAFYDAADARTVDDLRHYAGSFMAPEDSLHGWEMTLISPSRFAAYVCHRLVGTWNDARLEH